MNKPFNVDEMRRIIEQLHEPVAEPKPKSEPAKLPREPSVFLGKDERTSNQQTDQARLGRRQLVASCDLALLPTLARPPAEAIEMLKAWNVVRAMTALVAPKRKSLARNKTLDGTLRYSWGSTRHSEVAATRLMRGLRRCRISVPTGASGARSVTLAVLQQSLYLNFGSQARMRLRGVTDGGRSV